MARRNRKRTKWREPKRLVDPGPDEGGRYSPSPFLLQHGHKVEAAPQELRTSKDSSFPKRITTQRVIDRYKAQGHITPAEWNAANFLWSTWMQAGASAKITASYDPVVVSLTPSPDNMLARKVDAAALMVSMLADVPYRSRGCVRAVVIDDMTAADWARCRGYRGHDSERVGLARLRAGLQALVAIFAY